MTQPAKHSSSTVKLVLTDSIGVRSDHEQTQIVSAYDTPVMRKSERGETRPDALDLQASIAAAMTKFDA